MKKIILFFIVISLVVSCKTNKNVSDQTKSNDKTSVSAKNDGSSFENAIVINEKTESAGVGAEHTWLNKNYPGCKLIKQTLANHDKKPYDIMDIKTTDGEKKSIYFDISNFFGKF
ncbi:MAG: hypothetical protein PHD97_08250 [Bacteroidales bacterium]|nr:hypothetical protein [Bacteroidales bacterium]